MPEILRVLEVPRLQYIFSRNTLLPGTGSIYAIYSKNKFASPPFPIRQGHRDGRRNKKKDDDVHTVRTYMINHTTNDKRSQKIRKTQLQPRIRTYHTPGT